MFVSGPLFVAESEPHSRKAERQLSTHLQRRLLFVAESEPLARQKSSSAHICDDDLTMPTRSRQSMQCILSGVCAHGVNFDSIRPTLGALFFTSTEIPIHAHNKPMTIIGVADHAYYASDKNASLVKQALLFVLHEL